MSSMPLLSFESVSKYRRDGHRRVDVLSRASFELEPGASVGVWGTRRSGKTTLLRLATAVELPDEGRVLFDGRSFSEMRPLQRERLLRTDIGFVSPDDWRPAHRERVVEHVALPLLSTGASLQDAARAARKALERVGVGDLAPRFARTLALEERIRAMLARALVNQPRLLVVDEPASVPNLGDRDALCELLSSLARGRSLALLVASEDMGTLRCADALMSIGNGELVRSHGERTAEVLPFPAPPTDLRLERPRR